MTTMYGGETAAGGLGAALDVDALDDLVVVGPGVDRPDCAAVGAGDAVATAAPGRRLSAAADAPAAEVDARSIPPSATLRTVFWRVVRTTGPIVAADLMALAAAGAVAQAVMWALFRPAADAVGWWAAPAALLPLVVAYWLSGLYAEIWTHVVVEFQQLTRVTTVGLLAATAGAAVAWPLPLWCAAAWPAAVALVPLLRTIAHAWCSRRPWWGFPALVVGSGADAEAAARALLEGPRAGLRPVLISDPRGDHRTSILPVVCDPAALESIVRAGAICHAVVSLPDLSHRRLEEALNRYSRLIPHLLVLSDGSTLPSLWSAGRNGGRLSGIEVRNGLLLATLQAVKRALDVVVAVATLAAALPLMLVVAALIKASGPGPVFYRHQRIGRHGRLFGAWKFRSMRADGEAVLRDHLARDPAARAEWERDRKLRRDPRVTRLGRVLRASSIDELPQLWNVLRGDMSLVGPRPIVEDEVPYYGRVFRLYTSAKPGITGLWQVSGRNDIGYAERVQLDAFYIRHWSPWLDVYILAKTVVALLRRRGAY